jgi:hypothetical protein
VVVGNEDNGLAERQQKLFNELHMYRRSQRQGPSKGNSKKLHLEWKPKREISGKKVTDKKTASESMP